MTKVAVTRLEFEKARGVFGAAAPQGLDCVPAPPTEAELAAFLRGEGIRHAIVGVERYAGPLYEALSPGGVLARFGVGHDGIEKAAATRRRLLCTNTPGALDDSVAELTIGLILAAARGIAGQAARVRAGGWGPVVGRELRGRRLAVIGCGPIGRQVARIAAFGFGMEVIGCDVAALDVARYRREFGFTDVVRDFAAAVRDADFVTLHIPSTPATRHFINAERLSAMPDRAWLINTSRGAVVDECALFDALSRGRPAGAALDVFETEPYVPAAPGRDLRALDHTIMTSHIGSSTQQACDRMAGRALHNIALAEAGRFGEMDLLNPDVLPLLTERDA